VISGGKIYVLRWIPSVFCPWKRSKSHLPLPREGAKAIVILRKLGIVSGIKMNREFLPLLGEGVPVHVSVDWAGRGDLRRENLCSALDPFRLLSLEKVQKPPSLTKGRSKSYCNIEEVGNS